MWWVDKSHKSRVIGLVKDMTKSEARAIFDGIVTEAEAKQSQNRAWTFGEFVEEVYFPYYSRKWKASTRVNNMNRVRIHLLEGLGTMVLRVFPAWRLAGCLGREGQKPVVLNRGPPALGSETGLRPCDGRRLVRNPALLLFTPKEAAKPVRKVMNMKEVQMLFGALDQRERLVVKLAVMAGMRPREIFALTWGILQSFYADIRQRVYRGTIDSPKTDQSVRKAALPEGLLRDIEVWRMMALEQKFLGLFVSCGFYGAGDRDRTGDIQLGKMAAN
jgi:integrase